MLTPDDLADILERDRRDNARDGQDDDPEWLIADVDELTLSDRLDRDDDGLRGGLL